MTRNVRDFGHNDLDNLGVSAVHPDLFLSHMVSHAEYQQSMEAMAAGRIQPPKTPEELHAALGAGHPLLFQAMSGMFPGVKALPSGSEPAFEVFRGGYCLLCGRPLRGPSHEGICQECQLSGSHF